MKADDGFGFSEIEHTADWSIRVWAPDLGRLFSQAAVGMYWLMETKLAEQPRVERKIALDAIDIEALLVSFLSELLYLGESEELGFDDLAVVIQGTELVVTARGAPIAAQKKEIKAVTYHNLVIQPYENGYQVTIVFDV